MEFRPVVLLILDGFGINMLPGESPMQVAKKLTFEELVKYYPFTTLQASGLAVGLPWGEEGNSEVGHLTIGSGRVIYHHLPRIIVSIQDGSFFENEALLGAVAQVKESHSTLHLVGLFSSGSVHAYVDHLYALLDLASRNEVERVALHIYGDGRDSPPTELKTFLPQLAERMQSEYKNAFIASIIGRHFSMDRDDQWDRIEQAYNCMIGKSGESFQSTRRYIDDSYTAGITDEFLKPAWLVNEAGEAQGRIKSGDAVIFYNFREDSEREMAHAFLDPTFDKFLRDRISDLNFVTITEYDKGLPAHVAFPTLEVDWPLARVISYGGKRQLHIAETEKYAHATYFFNGGKEKPFEGEDRKIIQTHSDKPFDQFPEMSAQEVTAAVIDGLDKYDFILANFANTDMVGHTGKFEASVKSIEIIDGYLRRIVDSVIEKNGALIITADHGNVEEKRYRISGEPRTKHTANPVPFYLIAKEFRRQEPRSDEDINTAYGQVEGVISDVAPTILDLMNLSIPAEMTGISLLPRLLV